MAFFSYQGTDLSGIRVSGEVEATSRADALRRLAQDRIQPLRLTARTDLVTAKVDATEKGSRSRTGVVAGSIRLSQAQVILFTDELADFYPSGTGLSTTYSYYDNTGDQRLQDITNSKGSSVLSKFDYTYNPVGTVATWTQQTDSDTPTQYALSYDASDRLTDAEQTNTSTSATVSSNKYGYDSAGNRLLETNLSGSTTGQFNSLNQLLNYGNVSATQTVAGNASGVVSSVTINGQSASVTGGTNFTSNVSMPAGTNVVSIVAKPGAGAATTQRFKVVTTGTMNPSMTYDGDGNTLTDENGNSYQWDALNRVIQITYASGASSLFAYDGLSRRVQIVEKDASGSVTSTKNYLWVGKEVIDERDAANTVTKRFFTQGEQQSGTNYYYTTDHLGSVREFVANDGTIVSRIGYDIYGTSSVLSGSFLPSRRYTGDYFHQASGLSMTEYRFYDTGTGRWLSQDPAGEEAGSNLYQYVDDSPLNEVDLQGLIGCKWVLSIGHGHVPGTMPNHPNTNNSYYQQNGNTCTAYTGCGSNALNKGGLGGDFPPQGRNNYSGGNSSGDGSDFTPEGNLDAEALADLAALESKAKNECGTGCGCKQITITVICQKNPGDPDEPLPVTSIAGISALCGQVITIPCKSTK
jgi:RHS repeat-associated protein